MNAPVCKAKKLNTAIVRPYGGWHLCKLDAGHEGSHECDACSVVWRAPEPPKEATP